MSYEPPTPPAELPTDLIDALAASPAHRAGFQRDLWSRPPRTVVDV